MPAFNYNRFPYYEYVFQYCDNRGNVRRSIRRKRQPWRSLEIALQRSQSIQFVERHTHISANEIETETVYCHHQYFGSHPTPAYGEHSA